MKTNPEKDKLIVELRKNPIIQVACSKATIGRATYYRWRKESQAFSRQADEAIAEGLLLVNDIAESQLLSLIKEKQMHAISFWLRHRHASYTDKLEISGQLKRSEDDLSKVERKLIERALKLVSFKTEEYESPTKSESVPKTDSENNNK